MRVREPDDTIEGTKMKLLAATAVTLSLLASTYAQTNQAGAASASSQDSQVIRITRRGTQAPRQGPAENFTGSVRVDPLFQASAPARTSGSLVTFEPGARSNWHTHPLGQTLIVTAGTGRNHFPISDLNSPDVADLMSKFFKEKGLD